jgi:hypothetical protein
MNAIVWRGCRILCPDSAVEESLRRRLVADSARKPESARAYRIGRCSPVLARLPGRWRNSLGKRTALVNGPCPSPITARMRAKLRQLTSRIVPNARLPPTLAVGMRSTGWGVVLRLHALCSHITPAPEKTAHRAAATWVASCMKPSFTPTVPA